MIEYGHPQTISNIVDESQVLVTAAPGATVLYAAGFADTGPDNQPIELNSVSEYLFKFGFPNFKKHGQTPYNVINWLRNGGRVFYTRLLPYREDVGSGATPATFAGLVVDIGLSDSAPNSVKTRVRKLGAGRTTTQNNLEKTIRDPEAFKQIALTGNYAGTGDSTGYTFYPLLGFISKYKGEENNLFRVSMAVDNTSKVVREAQYVINLTDNASSIREPGLRVSLIPSAVDENGSSLFITDVLDEFSSLANAHVNEENYDFIASFVNADEDVAPLLDLITFTERRPSRSDHAGVTIAAGSASLTPSTGLGYLFGAGSDGTYVGPNSKESLQFYAYSGTGDQINPTTGLSISFTNFSSIFDKDRFPIDVLLDGNLPYPVKIAMANTASTRGDCVAFLDLGLTSSATQTVLKRQNDLPLNSFYSAIYCQDGKVFDPETNSRFRATATYELAAKIPANDIANGLHTTISGLRRGTVTNLTDITWSPDVPAREALYNEQINYIQIDSDGINFMTDTTSQEVNSALSEMPNVRVTLKIRRAVDRLGKQILREQQLQNSYSQLENAINRFIDTYRNNGSLSLATVSVYATAYDRQVGTARVRIELAFTGFIKRVVTDIVIKKTE